MIRAATMTNMPPQARFDEALYAVSRERQFTPRLIQARLVSYLQTPCGGLAFGAGIFSQALKYVQHLRDQRVAHHILALQSDHGRSSQFL